MANTREPILQPVSILSLRPTQMTVGMREVKEKRKRFREKKAKKQAETIGKHMIPVVLGPDKKFYVVDHHHLARALHEEGVRDVFVTVIADLTMWIVPRSGACSTTSAGAIPTMPRARAVASTSFRKPLRS